MNLRWLWFDHIPPELKVPKEARGLIRQRRGVLWGAPFNQRNRVVLLAFGAVFLGLALTIIITILTFTRSSGLNTVALAAIMLAPGIPIAMMAWIQGRVEGRCWRVALCQLGYLCCVKCGYPHTGLSKDVKECPECGAAREFGKCIHCNSPQDWAMELDDRCSQCGRMRLS